MIPAMPALIPVSKRNIMMKASHIRNKYRKNMSKLFILWSFFFSLEEEISKELRHQSNIVKVSEETLKTEREKLEKLEKEYAIIW